MRKFWLAIVLTVLTFSACGSPAPEGKGVPTDVSGTPPSTPGTEIPTLEPLPTAQPLETDYGTFEQITTENVGQLEQVARLGDGEIHDAVVSPDQSTLAVYVGDRIDLYDAETFELKNGFEAGEYENADRIDNIVLFSSDSSTLVYTNGERIYFRDLYEGSSFWMFSLIPEWGVVDIALSPDDDRIMVTTLGGSYRCDGRDMNFALYDLERNLIFNQYTCADYTNNYYKFTENGKVLLVFNSAMTGINPYRTYLVDGTSGGILEKSYSETVDYEKPVPGLTLLYDISPDGKMLAYGVYDTNDDGYSIHTEIVDYATRAVLDEQEGWIEFIEKEGVIRWNEINYVYSYNDTSLGFCDLDIESYPEKYVPLLMDENKAVLAIYHGGIIVNIEKWDIRSCEVEKTISYPSADKAVFSPDGQYLASTNGYNAYLWDVSTGSLLYSIPGTAFESPKSAIQFNSNGSRYLTGTFGYNNWHPSQPYRNYTVSVYETQSGELLQELSPDTEFFWEIIPTPEKDFVILWDSEGLHVWNIETGEKFADLPNGPYVFDHQAGYIWVAPSKEGKGRMDYQINLYNYHTGEVIQVLENINTHWIRDLYLDSSGTKLMANLFLGQGKENGDAIMIFDLQNGGEELLNYKLPWGQSGVSEFRGLFATDDSDGLVQIWNFESDIPLLSITGNNYNWNVTDRFWDYKDSKYSFSPGRNFIETIFLNENVLITDGEQFQFWDIENGSLLSELKIDYSISMFNINPEGTLMAVAARDGIIRFWGVPINP